MKTHEITMVMNNGEGLLIIRCAHCDAMAQIIHGDFLPDLAQAGWTHINLIGYICPAHSKKGASNEK